VTAGRYGSDVWSARRLRGDTPAVGANIALVVEDPGSGFCGAVLGCDKDSVRLQDRHGRERVFSLRTGAFLLDGSPVTLVRPQARVGAAPRRTASGSIAVRGQRARVAQASRIYVEGVHDAALIERVWGDDLRIEGIVVEPLHGIDDLPAVVRTFQPAPQRRLGVLSTTSFPVPRRAGLWKAPETRTCS